MTIFGKQIRYLRKRAHLTQEQLGKIIRVSASTVGMYERGSREPSFNSLVEIADYFQVSTDYLLGHTNDENTSNHSPQYLTEHEEKILHLKQEHPLLFNYLSTATANELKKLIQILKIIQKS